MFFSLLFPLPPIETTRLSSIQLKKVSSILNDRSLSSNNKNHSLNFSCFSLHKSHLLTSATNLVVEQEEEEEEEEEHESSVRLNDAGFSAEEHSLPVGLQREFIPNHVAMIMDGNVRWARHRGLPSSLGHEAGVRTLKEVIELCHKWGIRVLTVFAFSHDNWIRPQMEVDFLMRLFERGLNKEMENFMRKDIRVSVIGDSSKLPISLQKLINKAKETTKNNSGLQLIVAVSYSGRYDIIQACKGIAEKVKDGLIKPEDINESLINEELETNCTDFPYPDLLIRTSGELRVSNFMLWQLAYTELFFVRSLWPDFGEDKFIEALHSFQQRQRRYGGRRS